MLRVLCNAIVRKVQQRNQDSQKDTAPGIHFVKEKATASTISSAKTHNKKNIFYGDLATSNDWTIFFELPAGTQGILNKTLSSRYLPNYKTKLMVLSYLEAERFFFVGPELTVPIEE